MPHYSKIPRSSSQYDAAWQDAQDRQVAADQREMKSHGVPIFESPKVALPLDAPRAFSDEHGHIVIVGEQEFRKASFVEADRAFLDSWTRLVPDEPA